MPTSKPFRPRAVQEAPCLTPADQAGIAAIGECAALLLGTLGKEMGLTEEGILRASQVSRTLIAEYVTAQRSAGIAP